MSRSRCVQSWLAASGADHIRPYAARRNVPGVRKAVKWNSPFYGAPDREGWFLGYHCFDRYVKLTFFRGATLRPAPPVTSRYEQVRYFHIHEGDALDEAQLADWVRQASLLPGEKM